MDGDVDVDKDEDDKVGLKEGGWLYILILLLSTCASD
jgi:hypothetical protein